MPSTNATTMMNDEYFMGKALELAEQALELGEFPVGCILVYENRIVATGRRTHSTSDALNELDHAEINALRDFSRVRPAVDPKKVTLYCTLEPCLMCYGAILISGIGRIVYAYEDAMGGGTRCPLSDLPALYHQQAAVISSDVSRRESLKLFGEFFSNPDNRYWKDSRLAKYTLEQFTMAQFHKKS